MFVPVSCTDCGKPFQVPETALGQRTTCPWCQSIVLALPVSEPVPALSAPEPPPVPPKAEVPTRAESSFSPDDNAAALGLPQLGQTTALVPVRCNDCGKSFQVPETASSQPVTCPWCRSNVLMLPVPKTAPPAPKLQPAPPRAKPVTRAEAPLSLDDDVSPPARSPITPVMVLGVGLIVLVGMALTVAYRGYGSGRISGWGWTEFAPPDGSFGVALPGEPVEEDVAANPEGSVTGGKRYVVRGQYSRTTVWVAYADLAPALVAKLPADKDRVITAGVLRVERDREVSRLRATVTKEAEVLVGAAWGVELHMDTPEGNAVEWLVLAGSGPHPRLYTYGAEGKNLTPRSPACTKLFSTFRITE